jgi:hypothetical protein
MLLASAAVGVNNSARAGSVSFEISADTNGMVSGPGGLIDLQLNPASSPPAAAVSATVYGVTTDGSVDSVASTTGSASGDLTTMAGAALGNSESYNDFQQNFTVGTFFDVFVTFSGPEIGTGASGPWSGTVFTLTLFDSVLVNPQLYDSLMATFTINPNVDGNGNPIVDGTVGVSATGDGAFTVNQLGVPEPCGIVLLGLGVGAVTLAGGVRKRRVS